MKAIKIQPKSVYHWLDVSSSRDISSRYNSSIASGCPDVKLHDWMSCKDTVASFFVFILSKMRKQSLYKIYDIMYI